jgi:hypothetical protein
VAGDEVRGARPLACPSLVALRMAAKAVGGEGTGQLIVVGAQTV